ncbi:MAG: TonB-dependent receptor plug domain-containing protein, partial [Candidatus Dadabacteria bacterium]|nr:TonB-dependent receptor plug domain-containing protein [Candidatus Dadabacteria bacterium]
SKELKTVPSAVTVFTHDEIKRMGLDSLDELMNLVPGFQSYRTSSLSLHPSLSSRGRRIGFTASEI